MVQCQIAVDLFLEILGFFEESVGEHLLNRDAAVRLVN